MDAFEQLVAQILSIKGFWVRTSFKVDLTKEEKRLIERHSAPRWELDVLAYRAIDNTIYIVECKSYLDSRGVTAAALIGDDVEAGKRYKLFTEPKLFKIVSQALCAQLLKLGACRENPRIQLALACGKIRNASDREKLHAHFKSKGWELWDEAWLQESIQYMATESYENQIASVVSKLLLRQKAKSSD